MKKIFTYVLLAAAVTFTSCRKSLYNPNSDGSSGSNGSTGTKISPDGFTYKTTKDVSLNLTLQTNTNTAIKGVVVSVYLPNTTSPIFKGVTNDNGVLQGSVTVPASVTSLIIDPAYVGLMRNAQGSISISNSINAVIGGKDGFSGDIQAQDVVVSSGSGNSTMNTLGATSSEGITFDYPSPYTSSSTANVNTSTYPAKLGRPVYLASPGDEISSSLLYYLNSSLPEGKPVTSTHPQYLNTNNTADINVTATTDVYITYVAEGAGNLNTLAYYTYKTGSAPASVSDIKNATIIFANTSGNGSGGGLNAGDKVKLGNFTAGTSIGFILIQNGWNGSGIDISKAKFYSNYKLNPETTNDTKKHTVFLYDDVHELFFIGFEDLNRQVNSDEDFNDLTIYASASTPKAISSSGAAVVDKGGDSDGDGVLDQLDAFPNDATRAYISYYPSQNGYGTLAFEDNWPSKGDYDMNDLVVNYRYTFTSNAKNQVVDMTGEYTATAAGATYYNGFGVQLPVAASAVQSVTGQLLTSGYISQAGNGVEAGQTKAVIIPFDNHENLVKNPDGAAFVNTSNAKDKVASKTATVKVTFTSPVAAGTLINSAFNPFLISNKRRAYEIHLPGYAPTDKADTKLFGTLDDASSPAAGKYYISSQNWPWALNFTTQFDYPLEQQPINQAYLHFGDWASSNGVNFTDWYSSLAAGMRDQSKIYSK